jgi:ubiquinone biosynthesis protein UbiJ
MNAGLFQSAILSTVETCLNGLLSLDAAAGARLETMSGKVLQVQCEMPNLRFHLLVSDGRILLMQGDALTADASIRGRASALLKLLVRGNTAGLREDGIVISGDSGFLNALQQILQNLDVDWEYQLSKFIGDIPTQAISDGITGAQNFVRQSAANLRDDIDAYLHEEKKLFPDKAQLEQFYVAVDSLRLRADRLEARVARL